MNYSPKNNQKGFIQIILGLAGLAAFGAVAYGVVVGTGHIIGYGARAFYNTSRKGKALVVTGIAALGLGGAVAYQAHEQSKAEKEGRLTKIENDTFRALTEIQTQYEKQAGEAKHFNGYRVLGTPAPDPAVASCLKISISRIYTNLVYRDTHEQPIPYSSTPYLNDSFSKKVRSIRGECLGLSSKKSTDRYGRPVYFAGDLSFYDYLSKGTLVPTIPKEKDPNRTSSQFVIHFPAPG
jgi:hypothetical protein